MDDDTDQRLDRLESGQIELADRLRRLAASDRRQWGKIQSQQRHNAVFAGVIAIGVLLGVGELTSEDKASLQQMIVAVVVAAGGAGGIIGANSMKPPGDDGDEDR